MDINDLQTRIKYLNEKHKLLLESDEELDKTILNPRRLKNAIILYNSTDCSQLKSRLIYSIGKYIWYNYYLNLRIPESSADDLENARIYNELKDKDQALYNLIEKCVKYEIEKMENNAKFYE